MNETRDIVVQNQTTELELGPKSLERLSTMNKLVGEFISKNLDKESDLMTVPGIPKAFLSKQGAEKFNALFQCSAKETSIEKELGNGHLEVISEVTIETMSGIPIATRRGSCSTMEAKYRYRKAECICPACKKVGTIIKGKAEYGGGFICFAKKGGCGAKFADTDKAIVGQNLGKVENPDIFECRHPVRSMAFKRAYVAATITAFKLSQYVNTDEDIASSQMQAPPAPQASQSPTKPTKPVVQAKPVMEEGPSWLDEPPTPIPEGIAAAFPGSTIEKGGK